MSYPKKDGDILRGPKKVCNVVGSSVDTTYVWSEFWGYYTGRDFSKEKCGIKGCGSKAKVGGHMWVKGKREFCFILPICRFHNNSHSLDYPDYQDTKKNVRLVARHSGDLLGQEDMDEVVEGRYLDGQFEVTKVHYQTQSRKDFWKRNSGGKKFPNECRINRCTERATVGRRMWVKGLSKFVFVVPICNKHNGEKDFYYNNYKETNADTRIVAHDKQGARRQNSV